MMEGMRASGAITLLQKWIVVATLIATGAALARILKLHF
jgi:hypothetical protein